MRRSCAFDGAGQPVEHRGFHVYYGTQIPTEDSLLASFSNAIACCERLGAALNLRPEVLDLGGGFPGLYASEG